MCVCCNGSSGDDCSGHGTCVTFKCQCAAGFTNFECATLACPHDCTNHGICYNNGTLRVLLRGRLAAVTAVAVTAAMARVGSAKASATAAASTASAGAAGWVGLAGVAAQAG